jgi:hypothetical protein
MKSSEIKVLSILSLLTLLGFLSIPIFRGSNFIWISFILIFIGSTSLGTLVWKNGKRRVQDTIKTKLCEHKKWDCDTQIRTIKCRECGKKAWIEEYRNLY